MLVDFFTIVLYMCNLKLITTMITPEEAGLIKLEEQGPYLKIIERIDELITKNIINDRKISFYIPWEEMKTWSYFFKEKAVSEYVALGWEVEDIYLRDMKFRLPTKKISLEQRKEDEKYVIKLTSYNYKCIFFIKKFNKRELNYNLEKDKEEADTFSRSEAAEIISRLQALENKFSFKATMETL
jgi:hypothetical protein